MTHKPHDSSNSSINRRPFVKRSAVLASAGVAVSTAERALGDIKPALTQIGFPSQDSLVHPPEWESLNPGCWKIENGRLRRRLSNVGDRARRMGFPFHYESKGGLMQTDYGPSLPSNLVDSPQQKSRGGGALKTVASQTGREPSCRIPEFKTIPNAEIQTSDLDARPMRGTTSLSDGRIAISGLVDVQAGADVRIVAHCGNDTEAKKVRTIDAR
jgi:hypothetical protein